MKVGVVVLHYRYWPGVRRTLEAIYSQSRRHDLLILVDNHSRDGSLALLRDAFPRLEVVEADRNGGYGAGMNVGLATLLDRGADAVLLLTHECRMAPDTLESLVVRLEEAPEVGAVGPLLAELHEPGVVFSAGGHIDPRTWRMSHLRDPPSVRDWAGSPARPVEWLDGAAILLRADAARTVGMLNEDYFMYFEETEYLFRLRKAGWGVECVPAAVAWQASGGKPPYLWTRNRLRFLARTAPKSFLLLEVLRVSRRLLWKRKRPRSEESLARLRARRRALGHFLLRRWGPDRTSLDRHVG